uniref:3'-5' exonuclease n=1 Tax=Phaeodactylibacter xiamenensis TaxID=1524460 RepID=UPI0024A9593A
MAVKNKNIYTDLDTLPIYNFIKCTEGKLEFMYDSKKGKITPFLSEKWNNLYDKYCELTNSNETLRYYRLIGEIEFLEKRYSITVMLVDLLAKSPEKQPICDELKEWGFKINLKKKNAYESLEEIAQTTTLLKELFTDKTPEGIARYDNIQELLNGAKEFVDDVDVNEGNIDRSLAVFLQDIALLTDADEKKDDDNNKVSLMTIHAAKGLEYPYVYIVGLEENLFPSQLSLNSRSELEEERRLFYVALTRAEKEVNLSYAASRYRWGNLNYCEPSRFIEEIDQQFLEYNEPQNKQDSEEDNFSQVRNNYFKREAFNTFGNSSNNKTKGMTTKKATNSSKKEEKVIPPF